MVGDESRRHKVLITGVGGPAGRAASSFFRAEGFHVHGTDIRPSGGEVDQFSLVPEGDDPAFGETILGMVRPDPPFLFLCTVTEEIPAAAALTAPLRRLGVSVFATDPEMAAIANDKFLTARFLAARGIGIPRTLSDSECPSAVEAGARLGFPFIVKPRLGRGGRGVTVVRNTAAARNERRSHVVFQEFVGGDEYDVNLFASPAGVPVVTRVMLKTGLKEGVVGNATGVRPADRPDIARLADETVRVMRLEGAIDIDVRLASDGTPKVLEVNARVGANVLLAGGIMERMLQESFARVRS